MVVEDREVMCMMSVYRTLTVRVEERTNDSNSSNSKRVASSMTHTVLMQQLPQHVTDLSLTHTLCMTVVNIEEKKKRMRMSKLSAWQMEPFKTCPD